MSEERGASRDEQQQKFDDVIAQQEKDLAETERLHGEDDPATLKARVELADLERILGGDHPATKGAKRMLELG